MAKASRGRWHESGPTPRRLCMGLEVRSLFLHTSIGFLGLHMIILGGKGHVSIFPPRVLHGFVHPGKTSQTFRLDARNALHYGSQRSIKQKNLRSSLFSSPDFCMGSFMTYLICFDSVKPTADG